VDRRIREIMQNNHETCVKFGKNDDGYVDYVKGANIGGFVKVANAMLAQGAV
jgi:glutamate dehydrogenase (NADP+)